MRSAWRAFACSEKRHELLIFSTMSESPGAAKKMIVICDDNVALAGLMQHLLRKQGFSVLTSADGNEGLELIRSTGPDLLLLDLAMPGTDGMSVLAELRNFKGKRPYTIVISGQDGKEARSRAAALGSHEVWKKPFNAAELIGRIETLISQGSI